MEYDEREEDNGGEKRRKGEKENESQREQEKTKYKVKRRRENKREKKKSETGVQHTKNELDISISTHDNNIQPNTRHTYVEFANWQIYNSTQPPFHAEVQT